MGRTGHSSRTPGGRGRRRTRRAWGLCVLATLLLAAPAQAETGGPAVRPGIVVNAEVLNELARAAAAGPAAEARTRPALLPPPEKTPVSRLLVAPLRPVAGVPPAKPRRKSPAAPGAPGPEAPAPEAALPTAPQAAPAAAAVPPPSPPPSPPPGADVTESPPATPAPPPGPDGEPDAAVAALPPPAPPPAAEAPAPAAAPAPPQTTEATQSAALPPPAAGPAPGRFLFAAESAELSGAVKRGLETLAGELRAAPDRRIQLLAYAGGEPGGASRARRLSLSRALAVRAFLVEKGIATGRIDVRALGSTFKEGPADRVDVVAARR